MACHAEEKDSKNSREKSVVRNVIPALPLRPVERRPALDKINDAAPVEKGPEHGASEPVAPDGQATPDPDRALKIEFGEVERDYEQAAYDSPVSFGNNTSSVDVTPSSLLSGMFALARH
jgi:hypothetical protein